MKPTSLDYHKNIFIRAGLFLCLTFLFPPSPCFSDPFVDIASSLISRSPEVRIALKDLELARTEKSIAMAKYLPTVSGTVGTGENRETYQDQSNHYSDLSAGLSLSQEIFNMSKLHGIKGAEKRIDTARAKIEQAKQAVIMELALAWGAYWKALRQSEVSDEDISILEDYLESSKTRYAAGVLTITDVRLARTRLQGAQSQKIIFSRQVHRTREALREIIKMPVPAKVNLFIAALAETTLPDPGRLVQTHPAVRPLMIEVSALDEDIDREKADRLPTVQLTSTYTYEWDGEYRSSRYPHEESRIGVELNLPIYTGGSVTHNIRKAAQKKQRHLIALQEKRDEIMRDARAATFDLEQSARELAITRKQLEFARQTLSAMNEEYELGTRSSVDVFLAQADMINSKLSLISAREQHARFIFAYLFALGQLDIPILKDQQDS